MARGSYREEGRTRGLSLSIREKKEVGTDSGSGYPQGYPQGGSSGSGFDD